MKKVAGPQDIGDDQDFTEGIVDFDLNTIHIYGEINISTALIISKSIAKLDYGERPITIYINSPGGYYDPCMSILTDIQNCKNQVITDIKGIAFSAASFIAISGDKRRISKNGSIMIHSPRTSLIDSEELFDLRRADQYVAYMKDHYYRLMKTLLENNKKITVEKFMEKYSDEELYLSPKEAKKLGLVDTIY